MNFITFITSYIDILSWSSTTYCFFFFLQSDPVMVLNDDNTIVITSNRLAETGAPLLEQGMIVGQLSLADALIIGNCNNQVKNYEGIRLKIHCEKQYFWLLWNYYCLVNTLTLCSVHLWTGLQTFKWFRKDFESQTWQVLGISVNTVISYMLKCLYMYKKRQGRNLPIS